MKSSLAEIKAIIGLGNPGLKFEKTRHNIGFRVVDRIASRAGVSWKTVRDIAVAEINLNDHAVLLIKPQTFMNSSGQVIPYLQKDGIKPENIVVVHDELELPLGKIVLRVGGSHRGHNGLRSLIEHCGPDFTRLRFGIGRPENREDVPDYVLQPFEDMQPVELLIDQAADMVMNLF